MVRCGGQDVVLVEVDKIPDSVLEHPPQGPCCRTRPVELEDLRHEVETAQ